MNANSRSICWCCIIRVWKPGKPLWSDCGTPEAKVSSHYLVFEDGRIARMVPEDLRAWHAGVGAWQGDEDLNSRSIGIEIVNRGHEFRLEDGSLEPFSEVQIQSVIALCKSILDRYPIPPQRVVGHSDIAPDRKEDPGEHFPWARLAAEGIGLWPEQRVFDALSGAEADVEDLEKIVPELQSALASIGYRIEISKTLDAQTLSVVRAFQRRFVPDKVSGHIDRKTAALIHAVKQLYVSSALS